MTQGSFKPLTSTRSLPSLQDVTKQDTKLVDTDVKVDKLPPLSEKTTLDISQGSSLGQRDKLAPQTFYERAKEFGTKTSDVLFGGEKVTPLEILKRKPKFNL